jgi:lipoprotein-anchoring transpeptidase ErfK/SrfK
MISGTILTMHNLSRRDFLKLGGLALGTLAFSPLASLPTGFDDGSLLRVATTSVSVYQEPSDESTITGTWYRDELVHIYGEVKGLNGEPKHNPVWYRVWGGYMHRARLQRVKIIYNKPMASLPDGTRQLVEVTVPFTQAYQKSTRYGWQPNLRLYYESVHWVDAVEEGPDGMPWYRVFDASGVYYVSSLHVRLIPHEDLSPISPDVPLTKKRIDVNLTTQMVTALEYDKPVFEAKIASGLASPRKPGQISTVTPKGEFRVFEKKPSVHMGNGNLVADVDDYELPGVSWVLYFTEHGHAFHGTFWHDNFGTPMSHGCLNMRTSEARWLFRWALPAHKTEDLATKYVFRDYGPAVRIFY